jgi:hypothetical protein
MLHKLTNAHILNHIRIAHTVDKHMHIHDTHHLSLSHTHWWAPPHTYALAVAQRGFERNGVNTGGCCSSKNPQAHQCSLSLRHPGEYRWVTVQAWIWGAGVVESEEWLCHEMPDVCLKVESGKERSSPLIRQWRTVYCVLLLVNIPKHVCFLHFPAHVLLWHVLEMWGKSYVCYSVYLDRWSPSVILWTAIGLTVL